jgi:alkylation response protein AidB-like acyl-CoA dehydrogenase
MDFTLTDDQVLLRRSVREFAEIEIRPHVREWDRDAHLPEELFSSLGRLGLMGIQIPERYGGAGLSAVDYCLCIEELARVDPAVALSVAAHNGLCSAHILMFGSDEQRERYLPSLASGAHVGAWGLTEAASGSDAASLRLTARRDGEGWILDGAKTFTTHGLIGHVMVVMALTDRTKGHRGISAFIVDRGTPGMTPGKKEDKLGMRASDTSEVIFEGCRIPGSQLLGREGDGFVNVLQVLDAGRIGIAALAVGLAVGAYESARRHALDRHQFGRPIAEFDAVQSKLANMATAIEAARLLTFRAACRKDEGRRMTHESAVAKLYASEMAVRAAEDSVQIHGGYGFVKDYPAEKYFRDVKLTTIGEGTSEIQRLVIARGLIEAGG